MRKCLTRGILGWLALRNLNRYGAFSGHMLRIEATRAYLHGVKLARRSAIGLLLMGLMIGLICLGLLLFHAGLFILLPWTLKAKALLGLFLGAAYIGTGIALLRAGLTEQAWLDHSGAAHMLETATRPARQG